MWHEQTALSLDGLPHHDAPPLACPPLAARYRCTCAGPACPGRRQGILDWELTALQRRARAQGADVEAWVRNSFEAQILADARQVTKTTSPSSTREARYSMAAAPAGGSATPLQ